MLTVATGGAEMVRLLLGPFGEKVPSIKPSGETPVPVIVPVVGEIEPAAVEPSSGIAPAALLVPVGDTTPVAEPSSESPVPANEPSGLKEAVPEPAIDWMVPVAESRVGETEPEPEPSPGTDWARLKGTGTAGTDTGTGPPKLP